MSQRKDNMPWVDAIVQILRESKEPMHYADITEAIIDRKLRKDVGATPTYTVNANIAWSIKHEPEKTPFIRVGRGLYVLRASAQSGGPVSAPDMPPPETGVEENAGIVRALGMFWRRDMIDWRGTPELLGCQQGGVMVDFCDQRGIYLLHDVQRVVYVGQAAAQSLGVRLLQHTADRLNGRWDRFSWFGIRRVTDEGRLLAPDFVQVTPEGVITTLEAVLIEALEPGLNRKRGADLGEVEYLQVENPKRQNRAAKAQLMELMTKLQ
jgi:hypothetical protein